MLYVVPLLNIAAAVGVNKFIYRPKNKKILGERVSEGASTCGGSGSRGKNSVPKCRQQPTNLRVRRALDYFI